MEVVESLLLNIKTQYLYNSYKHSLKTCYNIIGWHSVPFIWIVWSRCKHMGWSSSAIPS